MAFPKYREGEKKGKQFEQTVRQQAYTSMKDAKFIGYELERTSPDGLYKNDNINPEATKNNIYFRRTGTGFPQAIRDYCETNHIDLPQSKDQILLEQIVITVNADYWYQMGWRKGQPATPELLDWANQIYEWACHQVGIGEDYRNVLAAALHLDEDAPHLQIAYIPVTDYKRAKVYEKEQKINRKGEPLFELKKKTSRKSNAPLVKNDRGEILNLDDFKLDDQGNPVPVMIVKKVPSLKDPSKKVPVQAHDADGKGLWRNEHGASPRICSNDFWAAYLENHKLQHPEPREEYLTKEGRDGRRPFNALQDQYHQDIGRHWGMDRGRVGSHGKGKSKYQHETEKANKEAKRAAEEKARADALVRENEQLVAEANRYAEATKGMADFYEAEKRSAAEEAERSIEEKRLATETVNAAIETVNSLVETVEKAPRNVSEKLTPTNYQKGRRGQRLVPEEELLELHRAVESLEVAASAVPEIVAANHTFLESTSYKAVERHIASSKERELFLDKQLGQKELEIKELRHKLSNSQRTPTGQLVKERDDAIEARDKEVKRRKSAETALAEYQALGPYLSLKAEKKRLENYCEIGPAEEFRAYKEEADSPEEVKSLKRENGQLRRFKMAVQNKFETFENILEVKAPDILRKLKAFPIYAGLRNTVFETADVQKQRAEGR